MQVAYIIFADESKLNLYWKALNKAEGYPNKRTLQYFDQDSTKSPDGTRWGVHLDDVILANLPESLSYPNGSVTDDHYYNVTFDHVEEWHDQPIDAAVHLRAWIGDVILTPVDLYDTSIVALVADRLSMDQRDALRSRFGYMKDGEPYVGTIREFNEYEGELINGKFKKRGLDCIYIDKSNSSNEVHAICTDAFEDHLSYRQIVYIMSEGYDVPFFTLCRGGEIALALVEPKPES